MEKDFKEIINSNDCVLVDFYATWCMPCKMISPVIEKIEKEHEKLKVLKIDVDENQDLAMEYNIMSIPTIKIFKKGKVTKTFVGVTDEAEIVAEI